MARDANTVGLVVGTLGVAGYRDALNRLRELLKAAGKRYYTIAVGRVNTAKLANFAEVDVFVLVACPESCFLPNEREYYKPVVTAFEMALACSREDTYWPERYDSTFLSLVGAAADNAGPTVPTGPRFSLISQSIVNADESDIALSESRTLATAGVGGRTVATWRESPAAAYYASRSWQGLEPRVGETPVTKAALGRSGVASGYSNEHEGAGPST